jgi:hypothetical protein
VEKRNAVCHPFVGVLWVMRAITTVFGVIAASAALATATVSTLSSSYPVQVASVLKTNGQWQIVNSL